MTSAHLSDKEIQSMIIEPEVVDEYLKLHLKKCRQCSNRLKRITEFTKAFQEQVDNFEIDWAIEGGRVLSAITEFHQPFFRWRWAAVFILLCILIGSSFFLKHIYLQTNHSNRIDETELLKEIWVYPDGRGEAEFPQSILLLAEWDKGDFSQFLNFFSPIEEEHNEKKDTINNNLSDINIDHSVFV